MMNTNNTLTAKHPIGVVATRTGISPDVLRAWERRYQAVTPQRTPTGRRLYTDRDIARLILLKQLIGVGRRISDVANLELEALEALVKEDRHASNLPETRGDGLGFGDGQNRFLDRAIDAVIRYDREALERTLAVAALAMSPSQLRERLIVPLMHEVGDQWSDGTLRVVQEHMASAIVKSFLENLRARVSNGSRDKIIVTTPAGQIHEMGALTAVAAAEEAGWEVIYLGPNLPAEEIGTGARRLGVRAVAISVAYVEDLTQTAEEIRAIRRHLGTGVALLVGGAAAPGIEDVIREVDGVWVEDLSEFQDHLERVRQS